mgnify:CR=1 FL=1
MTIAGMSWEIECLLAQYDPTRELASAETIPASWYLEPAVLLAERAAVFGESWQVVGRAGQLAETGQFITAEIAGEPVICVRGRDGELRAFHNVCSHHAAVVCTATEGRVTALRCPYHGWTYGLDGSLKGVPEFDGVRDFDKSASGLAPIAIGAWESFVLVRLSQTGPSLTEFLGDLPGRVEPLRLSHLRFSERRVYDLACNWKVYVDNYLDGGYHVPLIHAGLGSVLDYDQYRIETFDRCCLQSSPILSGGESETASVRGGDRAYYFWQYPNFMLNWYEGIMDTNLVLPIAVDRTRVVFDFYFADDVTERERSIAVAERVQREDIEICESVQRGLGSRAYRAGRLSVRREAGEHMFHKLLHADLTRFVSEMKGAARNGAESAR